MWLIQGVIGAALGWTVAKALDPLLDRLDRRQAAADEPVVLIQWGRWCLAHGLAGAVAGSLGVALGLTRSSSTAGVGLWTVFGMVPGLMPPSARVPTLRRQASRWAAGVTADDDR